MLLDDLAAQVTLVIIDAWQQVDLNAEAFLDVARAHARRIKALHRIEDILDLLLRDPLQRRDLGDGDRQVASLVEVSQELVPNAALHVIHMRHRKLPEQVVLQALVLREDVLVSEGLSLFREREAHLGSILESSVPVEVVHRIRRVCRRRLGDFRRRWHRHFGMAAVVSTGVSDSSTASSSMGFSSISWEIPILELELIELQQLDRELEMLSHHQLLRQLHLKS
jgi:hypothetical protein